MERPGARRSQLPTLDAFSPVNENGSFEFDRVLKSGKLLRRSKNKHVSCLHVIFGSVSFACHVANVSQSFKASWKPCYMVLRPNLLSVYKDEDEAQLQISIATSDISAVALVKAPKSKRPNVFGIFSPAKNYRFQAPSADDTDDWIHKIRSEFPATHLDTEHGQGHGTAENRIVTVEESAYETSDHEGHAPSGNPRALRAIPINPSIRDAPRSRDTDANEIASCSELSDTAGHPASFQSMTLFPATPVSPGPAADPRPGIRRDASQHSDMGSTQLETERVIFQGYLQCLKTIKGVRQWKKYWIVLRPHNLYFYKNNQEYLAISIISMDTVISAAEIDPISRSKPYCFQVIAEDKAHRFSAPDEETLDKWLGSLTSVLIKMHGAVPNPVAGVPLGAK